MTLIPPDEITKKHFDQGRQHQPGDSQATVRNAEHLGVAGPLLQLLVILPDVGPGVQILVVHFGGIQAVNNWCEARIRRCVLVSCQVPGAGACNLTTLIFCS